MARIVVYDLETTGLELETGDRIIEIAAVEIVDRRLTDRYFHSYVNPEGRRVNPDIIAKGIHHITDDMVADAPMFTTVYPQFLEFCKGAEAVAHNGKDFDEKALDGEAKRAGLSQFLWQVTTRVTDSLVLAKRVWPNKKNALDDLLKRYDIDSSAREVEGHHALLDSRLLAQVYLKMTDGLVTEGPSLEDDVPRPPIAYLPPQPNAKPLIVRRATDDEIRQHESYLDELPNALERQILATASAPVEAVSAPVSRPAPRF